MDSSHMVEYSGHRYRRYSGGDGYFRRSAAYGTTYLHRVVWEKHNGRIPGNAQIHHKDGDCGNNDISNLTCLSPKDHRAQHEWSNDRKSAQRVHLDAIRHLSKDWHSSPEGLEKHREVGALAYKNFVPVDKSCDQCGNTFLTKSLSSAERFCSAKCKSALRRASGVDNETRQCAECGKDYIANKYTKIRTCSRQCGSKMSYRNRGYQVG